MSGDPARTMALLWRATAGPTRGPKPGLDVDAIVTEAVTIADREGMTALSMRRVAQTLGVGTMSLYTYVPSKDELVSLMLDAVYAETPRPSHTPGQWRDNLERIARDNWDLCHRHPWMLQVPTGRPVLGPHELAKYDYELRAIDGIGLKDVEMDSVLSTLIGFVHATARAAVEKAATESATGLTDAQWWQQHAPLLSAHVDPQRYPVAVRVGEAAGAVHGASDPEHTFGFGLARLLEGVEALVRGRGADAA